MTYDTWKAELPKHLKHAHPDGVRERVMRDHYIAHRTPQQAAAAIDTAYLNSLSKPERIRRLNTVTS